MMGIGDSGRQIVFGKGTTQARHVLVGLLGRAAKGDESSLDQFLRARVVDIAGLEFCQDLNALFDRQTLMHSLRVKGRKGLLDHTARMFEHREHLRRRRQYDDLSVIDFAAPLFIGLRWVEKYTCHAHPNYSCYTDNIVQDQKPAYETRYWAV